MKLTKLITLLLVGFLVAQSRGRGQVLVYDRTHAEISVTNHLAEVLKLVAIIEQLETTKNWLGNAGEILDLAGLDEVLVNLQSQGVGLSRVEIATAATSFDGTTYEGDGLYTPLGETYLSRSGEFITRPDVFRPEAAIFSAVRDHDAVFEDVKTRRTALRSGMQKTVAQLQAATTHVEVLKATGVMIAQSAELEATDREETHAAEKVAILSQQNAANKERTDKAKDQEQAVEFHEALQVFVNMLRPPSFVPEPIPPAKGGSGNASLNPITKAP